MRADVETEPGSSSATTVKPVWKEYVAEACSGEAYQLFCSVSRRARSGRKTRRIKLIGRRCTPQIYKTFLGYEVIGARKRVLCPDLTTARYLRIFAEIGLKEIDLPYDVTYTRDVLPELERSYASLRRILDFFVDQLISRPEKNLFLRRTYANLQLELTKKSADES
jgi:hypothetical protein